MLHNLNLMLYPSCISMKLKRKKDLSFALRVKSKLFNLIYYSLISPSPPLTHLFSFFVSRSPQISSPRGPHAASLFFLTELSIFTAFWTPPQIPTPFIPCHFGLTKFYSLFNSQATYFPHSKSGPLTECSKYTVLFHQSISNNSNETFICIFMYFSFPVACKFHKVMDQVCLLSAKCTQRITMSLKHWIFNDQMINMGTSSFHAFFLTLGDGWARMSPSVVLTERSWGWDARDYKKLSIGSYWCSIWVS